MIAEIQVLPSPTGPRQGSYAHVDAAIAVLAASGLHYEVGPLGTSFEGSPEEVWPLLRRVHEAALESGAATVVTVVKVAEGTGDEGPAIDDLVGKFRP